MPTPSLLVVAPVLEAARPSAIVEIGAGDGARTRRLLELSSAWGGTLHAIDPLPRFPVDEWVAKHGARFHFHRDSSLNALARIGRADAYLVDGDHNWYTVTQELKSIERAGEEAPDRPFPIVFLYATGWPHARRDSYCDPRTVPPSHVHRFRRGGVVPDQAAPGAAAGLFPECNHALSEGAPRNGVLTALDDFLLETKRKLTVFRSPAYHGLAIIADTAALEAATPLAAVLGQLRWGPLASRLLEDLEGARIAAEIASTAHLHEHATSQVMLVAKANESARQHAREVKRLQGRHERLMKQQLRELTKLKNREIRDRDKQVAAAARELAATTRRLKTAGHRIAALTRIRERLERRLAAEKVLAQFRVQAAMRAAGHPLAVLFPRLARAWLAARERYSVRPALDAAWYLRTYPDVRASGADPADHYVRLGAFEGRDPAPSFSTVDYLLGNSDVVTSGVNPLAHYTRFGAAEGRKIVPARVKADAEPGEPRG